MAIRLHQDCGNKADNPEWARWASGSQSEHRNCFILPARRASHTIKRFIHAAYNFDDVLIKRCLHICFGQIEIGLHHDLLNSTSTLFKT